jgi:Outer membrane protein beta-barrel domain
MLKYFCGVLLLGAMAITPLAAHGAPSVEQGRFEVAMTYNPVHSNTAGNNSFWMQGGSVQVEGRFWRGLGVVADIAGTHAGNINSSGVGLDMVTSMFGPRYTWIPAHHKLAVFGEGLVGVANGFNSVFPFASGASTSANGLAVLVGGGANVEISRHFAIRAIEADWLHTQLPNGTSGVQDNLRLGAGVVLRFK